MKKMTVQAKPSAATSRSSPSRDTQNSVAASIRNMKVSPMAPVSVITTTWRMVEPSVKRGRPAGMVAPSLSCRLSAWRGARCRTAARQGAPAAVRRRQHVLELPGIALVDLLGELRPAGRDRRPVGIVRLDPAEVGPLHRRGRRRGPSPRSRRSPPAGWPAPRPCRRATALVTCSPVAFWNGASARASWIDRREPYQSAFRSWP